jgi:hypothetical protein
MKTRSASIIIGLCVLSAAANFALADGSTTNANDTSYGLFNALDHRSSYGQFFFPEPFLVDDSDLEPGEFRLDWLHTRHGSDYTDVVHPEIEYAFGLMTMELEAPYERDVSGGAVTKGFDNVDVGARYPFYQFVSGSQFFDTTFGLGVELGIPTTSDVSHNTELVPKVFSDTRIGNFTAQAILGYSMLYGPGDDGGVNTFEYGFVFGYVFPHDAFPLPGVDRLIPVAELSGETQLNKSDAGHNSLTADIGLRVNCKSIGRIQPRPGVVFVFPVDSGSREETHWGIMTSLVFEF